MHGSVLLKPAPSLSIPQALELQAALRGEAAQLEVTNWSQISYMQTQKLISSYFHRQARELQAALRGEAAQLEAFIPVLIQGAASGISDALKQQVRVSLA